MMDDCIFKSDAYIELMKCKDFDTDKLYHGNHYLKIACDVIRSIPPVDVVERPLYERALSDVVRLSDERKKGKWWVEYQPNGKPYCLHCSVCDNDGNFIGITTAYNYCPNCGAKMEVEA